jgi:hypothetical protein
MHTGFWWGNLEEEDPFEDLGIDNIILVRIILKFMLNK